MITCYKLQLLVLLPPKKKIKSETIHLFAHVVEQFDGFRSPMGKRSAIGGELSNSALEN